MRARGENEFAEITIIGLETGKIKKTRENTETHIYIYIYMTEGKKKQPAGP